MIEGRVEPRSADPDGGQHSPRRPGQHSPHPRRIREKVSLILCQQTILNKGLRSICQGGGGAGTAIGQESLAS